MAGIAFLLIYYLAIGKRQLSKKAAITASAKDLIRNFMQIRDLAFKALF